MFNTSKINRTLIIQDILDTYPVLPRILKNTHSIKCWQFAHFNNILENSLSTLIDFGILKYNNFHLTLAKRYFIEQPLNFPTQILIHDDKKLLLNFLNHKEKEFFQTSLKQLENKINELAKY